MTLLQRYLLDIRQAIGRWTGIRLESYREQLLTATRGNLRVRLRLADDSLLEISEALVVHDDALAWLSYRYHWQDGAGHLIFRYDNAPHYPEIETFPHHKHVGETVIAAERPHLLAVIEEIQRTLSSP
jgi:uncharacterized protein DUF6516